MGRTGRRTREVQVRMVHVLQHSLIKGKVWDALEGGLEKYK